LAIEVHQRRRSISDPRHNTTLTRAGDDSRNCDQWSDHDHDHDHDYDYDYDHDCETRSSDAVWQAWRAAPSLVSAAPRSPPPGP
jgi:hypothetical protein